MHLVYTLYSEKLNHFYIGATNDLDKRIREHNTVKFKSSSTSRGIPWVIYLSIEGFESEQAYLLENYTKKIISRK
jgi:putative endonuclease